MHIKETISFGGRDLTIESGKIAKQASGSCYITYGDTVVFVAVTASKGKEEDRGFLPLSVDYREKFYASGRIPGGFFKREARPSEREILASRLTDRPLRPLFPKGFNNETRVDITVLSYDDKNEPDVLSALGASYALMISDIPFGGPIASVRVGRVDGEMIVNPSKEELESSDFDLTLSGSDESIVMVEGKCDFISEDEVLNAIQYGHEAIKDLISFQNKLVSKHDIVKREIVEDADRGHSVVRRIDHIIGYETFDIADDRDRAFLDPARQFLGHAGFCLSLTNGCVHSILLHWPAARGCDCCNVASRYSGAAGQRDCPRAERFAVAHRGKLSLPRVAEHGE